MILWQISLCVAELILCNSMVTDSWFIFDSVTQPWAALKTSFEPFKIHIIHPCYSLASIAIHWKRIREEEQLDKCWKRETILGLLQIFVSSKCCAHFTLIASRLWQVVQAVAMAESIAIYQYLLRTDFPSSPASCQTRPVKVHTYTATISTLCSPPPCYIPGIPPLSHQYENICSCDFFFFNLSLFYVCLGATKFKCSEFTFWRVHSWIVIEELVIARLSGLLSQGPCSNQCYEKDVLLI